MTDPKPSEARRVCGLHADRCTCDEGGPVRRPLAAVPPPVTYLQARRNLRPEQGD